MKTIFDWLHKQPITIKLKMLNLATSGIVIVIASLMLILAQPYFYSQSLLDSTGSHSAMISENVSAAIMFSDKKATQEILSSLKNTPEIEAAAIYDQQGNVLANYYRNGNVNEYSIPAHALKPGHHFTPEHLIFSEIITFKGKPLGTIYILASLSNVYIQMLWYLATILVTMGISLLVANLILARLQKEITDPILSLAKASEYISAHGDYSVRVIAETSDEVGQLGKSFNLMLERIQKRDADLEDEIIQRKRVEVRLEQLAHYDTVTSLSNRHFFNDRLISVVSRAQQFKERAVVMYIDLDNFKIVNDTLGHDAGDVLLRIVAERLDKSLRHGDAISRVGGDEFAIILENVEKISQAIMVAEKCLACLSEPILIDGNELYISASIGISACPDDASDMHELLKHADTAMYYAKNKGKNTYQVFLPDMKDEAQKRLTLENSLRRALERNEFTLYYQPQIDMQTHRMIGVEALIRWMHPELGIVNPAEFIPIAEDNGLIVPIGEWVLKTACEQLKAWHDMELNHLTMAVNLSGRQLKEENLVERVAEIVRQSGIDPKFLHLELTESMLMDAGESTMDKLQKFRAMGIELAIDDFGTGYSSMSYLKRFPINTLKVDKSFVRDLPQRFDDSAITIAIISMAHSMKMDVIAEGVETNEQADFLMDNGCNNSQGFLFSRPVPADQIIKLIEKEII